MDATTSLPPAQKALISRDWLRIGLLVAAFVIGAIPVFRFVGSMIWFHRFLGDYQVFWGIGSAPLKSVYGRYGFPYPVTALLLVRPFGLLPFWPSFIAWGAAGAAAVALAARRMISPRALALGFCSSAAISVIAGGQTSLFVGALIIAGLSARDARLRGAFLAAAAVIKPQSLLAAPIAMIAGRDWRAIGWALVTSIALLALSVAVFGVDTWVRWAVNLFRFPTYLTSRGIDLKDVGAYGLVRGVGLPGWMFVIAIPPALITSWSVFRAQTQLVDRYAAFACCTVMMSPYTLSYDLAGLSLACVAMLMDRERSPLIWVAAALILSTIFANIGIVLMTGMLGYEAVNRLRAEKSEANSSDIASAAASLR